MQPTHAEQQSAANAAIATSYDRLASRGNSLEEDEDDEDEIIEQDPEGKNTHLIQRTPILSTLCHSVSFGYLLPIFDIIN